MLAGSATAAPQDFTVPFTKCAITKDDKQRLACFDKITAGMVAEYQAKNKTPADEYLRMQLIDLKTDIKGLHGRKISTSGLVQIMGEMAMLKSDPLDMTPLMINTQNLPREDRKRLLGGCLVGCPVDIAGRVASGPLGQEIDVSQLHWR